NSRYLVFVRQFQQNASPVVHLSIKRRDSRPHIPYRDLMRIKGEILGEECEVAYLLPVRSMEDDLANQTHLWPINHPGYQFPFGLCDGRLVSDVSLQNTIQEPWPLDERPADCLSLKALQRLFEQGGRS